MMTATLNKVTILVARAKADKEANQDAVAIWEVRGSKADQAGAVNKVNKALHLIAAVNKVNKVSKANRIKKADRIKKANRVKKVNRERKARKAEFLQTGKVHL
jgi:hypothetical protein